MDIALSLLVLASIALCGGSYVLWRRGMRRQALLMIVLAVVMVMNVAIWTVPTQSGGTLVTAAPPT